MYDPPQRTLRPALSANSGGQTPSGEARGPAAQAGTLHRFAVLRTIAEHLNRAVDLQSMLDTALPLILELMGLNTGWITLMDETGRFYSAASHGLPPGLTAGDRAALRWSPCRCQRMLLDGEFTEAVNIVQCECLERVRQVLQGQGPEAEEQELGGLRYHAIIPLRAGGQVLGVLNLARAGDAPLGEEELALLSLVGETLGVAIQRTQLYERVKAARLEEQEALLHLSQTLLGLVESESIARTTFEVVDRHLAPDAVSLLLPTAGSTHLELVAARGWAEAYVGRLHLPSEPPESSGVAWAVYSHAPVFRDHTRGDQPAATPDVVRQAGVQTSLIVPMLAGGRAIGVLVLDSLAHRTFNDDEVRFLSLIANQAAIALDRAREHQATRQAEARYRGLFDGVPVGLYRSTPEGKVLDANLTLVRMLGYPDREALPAANAADLYVEPQDRLQWLAVMRREGVVRDFETRMRRQDGTAIWVRDTARAVRDENGQVLYYEGSLEDITGRKQAEEALRESEARFRAVFEGAAIGIALTDLEGRLVESNPTLQKMYGYSGEELHGMTFTELTHLDDVAADVALFRELVAGERDHYRLEKRYIRKDGRVIWGRLTVSLVRDTEGRPQFSIAMVEDITERKRAEESLWRMEERYRNLFEEAPAMYVITRDQGGVPVIADCNMLFLDTLDYTWAEVLERPLADFYTPDSRAKLLGGGYQPALEGGSVAEECQLLTRDGRVIETLLRVARETDDAGNVVGMRAMYVDITERLRSETELAMLYELARGILSALELPRLLERVYDGCRQILPVDTFYLALYDRTSQTIEIPVYLEKGEDLGPLRFPLAEGGLTGYIVRSGQSLLIGDLAAEAERLPVQPRIIGTARQHVSYLGVPLVSGGQVVGVLSVQHFEPWTYDRSDLETLERLGGQVAIALENARLFEAGQAQLLLARTLQEVGALLTSRLGLDEVLENIFDLLARVVSYDSVSVQLLDEEGRFYLAAGRGFPDLEKIRQTVRELSNHALRTIWGERKPIIIPDTHNDSRWVITPETEYIRSWVGAPLMIGDRFMGTLNVDSRTVNAYDEAVGETVAAFANQAAVAIENARLFEAAWQRAQEAETLRQAGAVVVATLQQEEAIKRILEQLACVVPSDSASVQLLREGYLEIVGGRGWPDPATVIGLRFPVPGDNPNTVVIQQRRPHILHDAPAAHAPFREEPHSHIRSWLGVPLIVHDRVIGMLTVDSTQPRHFTPEHARLATAFADQVAIALENARLYARVQRLAVTDSLTGLYNSRHLYQELEKELQRSRRYGHPCSLLMLDLDDFKQYNDRYGHLAGDDLLRELARLIGSVIREVDTAARYGGEEFAVILPETDGAPALAVAERLRQTVRNHKFVVRKGQQIGRITVSIGVATFPEACAEETSLISPGRSEAQDAEELIHAADMALLQAKEGKDQVCVWSR